MFVFLSVCLGSRPDRLVTGAWVRNVQCRCRGSWWWWFVVVVVVMVVLVLVVVVG